MAENEAENVRVAKIREKRLAGEREEMKVRIEQEKLEHTAEMEEKRLAAEKLLRETEEAMANRITEENLDEAILQAIENPVDPEFAIATEGHIYRGRYTRSMLVPEADREKIPTPANPNDLLSHKEREAS